jgi:hypothetical protein
MSAERVETRRRAMTPEQAQQRSFWKWTAVSVGMLAALALVAVSTGAIEVPALVGKKQSKKDEPFLDLFCGVSLLKLFGFNTEIYHHRVVGAADSDLHPTLTRAYTVGFLPHQTDADTSAFANPPCYISQAYAGSLAEAQDHIVRTLRDLNATASATTRPRVFANALVALLANDNSRGSIRVVLYAPSHSRDGLVQPNYDALGRAHRWLFRLMTGPAYKIDDPRFSSTNGSLSHVRTCLGAPETTRDVAACSTETTYVACGCIGGSGCSPRPKYRSANLKRAVQSDIYVAYEIRLSHPAIAGLVSRAANSPRALLRNCLPESAEMRQGMSGALVSPNGAYAALITARGGLRVNGVVVIQCPPGRIAGSVTIDGKNLALQTVAGDPIAEMQVAEGSNIKTPVTLVLKSNGQFAVYDAANADVTSAAVKSVNAAIREDDPTAGAGDGSGYDGDSLGVWDPVSDYRWRIEMLLNWLRARDLLSNYDVNSDAIDKSALLGALGQSSGQAWGSYGISAMPPYDPSVNYTERLLALAAVLRRAGLDVPSDAALLATTSFTVQTAAGKRAVVEASSPMWGELVTHENATTASYDPDAEYQKRLAAAFG